MTVAYTPADLKTQITTGALGTALSADVTADNVEAIAAVLNATTGDFAGSVPHSPISNSDFVAALTGSELENLTQGQKDTITIYLTPGTVNIGSANVQGMIESVFGPSDNPACPLSHAALVALYTRPASFVEARYGSAFAGGVTTDQVQAALEA